MLLFTNCTLLLTDGEFSDFLSEINEVALRYMKVEAKADRQDTADHAHLRPGE